MCDPKGMIILASLSDALQMQIHRDASLQLTKGTFYLQTFLQGSPESEILS